MNRIINTLPLLVDIRNEFDCMRIVNIFRNKDFEFNISNGNEKNYNLTFSDKFGYKTVNSNCTFYFNRKEQIWTVKIDQNKVFYTKNNPCFMLISEMRGYTLLNNISENDVVIDVGASDGISALYFSKLVGLSGKVFALEPDPRWHKVICENIRQNKVSNILLLKKALYNDDSGVTIDFSKDMGAATVIIEEQNNKYSNIESICISSLLAEYNVETGSVRLVKLDIEGAELDLLDSLIAFVTEHVNAVICIASYHIINGVPTYKSIEDVCKNNSMVIAKTVYPYHTTTYIVNSKSKYRDKLFSFPSYELMHAQVWAKP